MNILFTGDTHGSDTIKKLGNDKVRRVCSGTFPDYVILAGDFGLVWSEDGPTASADRYWLSWLAKKPWETIVVPGNHENHDRILALPQEERFGDVVYRLNEKVFFTRAGGIYTIDGQRIFTFGGAQSIDREERVEGKTWWSREIPSSEDLQRGIDALIACDGRVDYVVTHTAPTEALEALEAAGIIPPYGDPPQRDAKFADPVVGLLDQLCQLIDKDHLKRWYFGHFHRNREFTGPRTSIAYHLLYDRLA